MGVKVTEFTAAAKWFSSVFPAEPGHAWTAVHLRVVGAELG